jgi:molybdopterin molybdotransferase
LKKVFQSFFYLSGEAFMSDHEFLTLKPVAEVLSYIQRLDPVRAEIAPISQSLSRVLAEPVIAPENLPGFNRSTVDGFAVRAEDVFGASEGSPAMLELVGEAPMGEKPDLTIGASQAARVWTGGMLPQGSNAVAMLERARTTRETPTNSAPLVEIVSPLAPGDNLVLADEDVALGETVLEAGRLLGAPEVGLLAAIGVNNVVVRNRPKISIISSGDELVPADQTPKPGQVRDLNSWALGALIVIWGGEPQFFGLAPDNEGALLALAEKALEGADALVISGGSSAGQRDFTLKTFKTGLKAEVLVHGVAMSPGKPLILGFRGQQSLWGLPGHPAGALVAAEVFLRPLIIHLLKAQTPFWPKSLKARLSRPVFSAQGRRDYIRVKLSQEPSGELVATPILGKSALITTLVKAAALAICPEELEGLAEGDWAEIQLLTPGGWLI